MSLGNCMSAFGYITIDTVLMIDYFNEIRTMLPTLDLTVFDDALLSFRCLFINGYIKLHKKWRPMCHFLTTVPIYYRENKPVPFFDRQFLKFIVFEKTYEYSYTEDIT